MIDTVAEVEVGAVDVLVVEVGILVLVERHSGGYINQNQNQNHNDESP